MIHSKKLAIIIFYVLFFSIFNSCIQAQSNPNNDEAKVSEVGQSHFEQEVTTRIPNGFQGELHLGTYGTYSPETLRTSNSTKIFHGGWASSYDTSEYFRLLNRGASPTRIFGPDKIYVSKLLGEVNANTISTKLALAVRGYHVNDPTVIKPPSTPDIDRSKWLYMYFTMLDNRIPELCRSEQRELLDCPEVFTGHDIGFASSTDQGESWTFHGIVVKAANSADGEGAWMPSAQVIDNQIYLYYSTGRQTFDSPNIYLQKIHANGHSIISSPDEISIEGFQVNQLYANISVKYLERDDQSRFLMVANSGDQTAIHSFNSTDGINFRRLSKAPLMKATQEGETLITPFIETYLKSNNNCQAKIFYTTKRKDSAYETRSKILNFTCY